MFEKIIDNKIIPWISLIPSKSEYSWRCGFVFADLQIHRLALVIVEYLLCVSYMFHKWKIM